MPQIDPKFMFWFGVWTNVLMLIAGYSVDHAPAIVAQYAPAVQWLCGVSYKINGVILTAMAALSSSKTGVFVPEAPAASSSSATPTILKVLIAAFLLSAFLFAPPAMAQSPRPRPLTGNIANDFPVGRPLAGITGAPVTDLENAFNAKVLPDLQYALKLAQASKNSITGDCYQAWIDIINTQQTAVQTKSADGTMVDIPMPDPHVITEFEKLVELRNALQPESPFMVKCSPVASMVKKDIAGFMGVIISGGAGLATLVPGL